MLGIPYATRNGSKEHFAKTNRPPACCLQNCPGGPFYIGLAPARNKPTGIGSEQLMTCGRMSAVASRRRPAIATSTKKLLINARRLPVVNGFSTRRLLVTLWPNALLLHDRWRQPKLSSCGFAAAASTSGSPARLHGNSNARPLLHICNTSRTAAHQKRYYAPFMGYKFITYLCP